jgi:hypothetical protein
MLDSPSRYCEVGLEGKRLFELFEDRVIVTIRSKRREAEITTMLANLRPEPNRVLIRPEEFGYNLLMLLVSVGFAIFGAIARGRVPAMTSEAFFWVLIIAGSLFVYSLVILWKTPRKIEFVQFVSHDERPLLNVARAGPQRAEFDSFVQTLTDRIRANQREDLAAHSDC